jgi:hypothetical protein
MGRDKGTNMKRDLTSNDMKIYWKDRQKIKRTRNEITKLVGGKK